jgi:hypothetical protein
MMYFFIIGFLGYFLVKYRLGFVGLVHKAFTRNEERKDAKRLRTHVTFFELDEVWPEGEPEKKKAS